MGHHQSVECKAQDLCTSTSHVTCHKRRVAQVLDKGMLQFQYPECSWFINDSCICLHSSVWFYETNDGVLEWRFTNKLDTWSSAVFSTAIVMSMNESPMMNCVDNEPLIFFM